MLRRKYIILCVVINISTRYSCDSPPPPKFQIGGASPPPNFTHCLHNELHFSVVDSIACRHCSSSKSHFCCLKKCRPPQVKTSSYAYAMHITGHSEETSTSCVAGLRLKVRVWYCLINIHEMFCSLILST